MPTSQSQSTKQNDNTDANSSNEQQPLQPSRRHPPSGLYGMLRKTKTKTYSALRGSSAHRAPNRPLLDSSEKEGQMQNDDDDEDDGTPSAKKRRTPDMASIRGTFIEPSNSFYFSTQNSTALRGAAGSAGGSRMQSCDATRQVNMEDVVSGVESFLRKLVVCCVVFLAGTMMPHRAGTVQKLLELSLVAWGTCLTIIGIVWFQKIQQRKIYHIEEQQVGALDVGVGAPAGPPTIERRTTILDTDHSAEVVLDHRAPDLTTFSRKRSRDEIEDETTMETMIQMPTTVPKERPCFMPKHLKQLEDLFIMLVGKQERLSPNGAPVKIDNDLFYGDMLFMFRTSEVDEPPQDGVIEDPVCSYFREKQRRFEFQWQLRLKKVPSGDVYLGCELDEPIAMGMIQRALVNTALKFVKKMNLGFAYQLSDSSDSPSYLSFPLGTSMDRFVATKPGDQVPQLGKEIFEDPEAMKRRKRGGQIDWNTNDVYTMALWSAYFDWSEWQILNFPGIRPFSATSVAGVQPIKLTVYTTHNTDEKEICSKNPKRDVWLALEVSNAAKASLGKEAKAWEANYTSSLCCSAARVVAYAEEGSVSEKADNGEDVISDEEEEEDNMYNGMRDAEDAAIEALKIGSTLDNFEPSCYVSSGSCLSLREGTGSFVASGGGYAVLQRSSTSVIVLEKIFRTKKSFSHVQKSGLVSDPHLVIRNGDVVRVKLLNLSSNVTRYLRIHRGWWLRWTSNRPTKTSSFYIFTNESDAAALLLGTPFSLRSRKWPNYHVGVCHESSAKFGGRMLAMYKDKADKSLVEEDPPLECDEEDDLVEDDDEKDFVAEKPANRLIMPLLLCAESVDTSDPESSSPLKRSPTNRMEPESKSDQLQSHLDSSSTDLTSTQYEVDCPVWLEVMNRSARATQLVYAVRVKEMVMSQNNETAIKGIAKRQSLEFCDIAAQTDSGRDFQGCTVSMSLKLRSGKEIAPILNLGIRHRNDFSASDSRLAWEITNLDVDHDGRESGLTADFTNQDCLQRNNSFTSSSDDSNSDDEVMEEEPPDVVIAGPNSSSIKDMIAAVHGDCATIYPEEEEESETNNLETQTAYEKIDLETELVSEGEIKVQSAQARDKFNASTASFGTSAASEHRVPTPKSFVSFETSALNDGYTDQTLEALDLTLEENNESKKKSKTKVLNRVAKTVKSSTVITGKQVLKQSKKVGKATVNTGRAAGRVIPNSYKPPKKHEPGGVFSSKKSVKNHSMKLIGRAIKSMERQCGSEIHSGQLLALDHNREKISKILSQLSTNRSSAVTEELSLFVRSNSEQDLAFLRGCSAELGVVPLRTIDPQTDFDCICARGIWEGRWREELCVLYRKDNHLAFYAPLSRKPSLVISFEEVISVRKCDPKPEFSPLAGFPLVSIDTTWRCHYLAFLADSDRESFIRKTNDAMYRAQSNDLTKQNGKVAQEWESFKMSLETSLTGSGGKWASVTVGKKSKQKRQRRIFNGRRMTFDLESVTNGRHDGGSTLDSVASFTGDLLRKALTLSPEALNSNDSSFTDFLDASSRLRSIPLHEIDYDSKEALCIFVNVYHCLLQHALLFAVDGLPDKPLFVDPKAICYSI
eukprot:CCRYP_009644-RB/>CCRYP_009644-RB protein AED:0.18 eAED:0.18 QI:322/1/1/1/0.75/0.8/5/1125/1593